jgi:hypothetical protein
MRKRGNFAPRRVAAMYLHRMASFTCGRAHGYFEAMGQSSMHQCEKGPFLWFVDCEKVTTLANFGDSQRRMVQA